MTKSRAQSSKTLISLVVFTIFFAIPGYGANRLVKIGLASNFSDPSSSSSNPYGDYFRNGVKLALMDSQKELQSKGLQVEFEEFDYGTNQIKVLDAAKAAAQSDVLAVLGYNFSSHALLAAPIHQANRLPLVTPSATADRIATLGAYVHMGCFNNSFMGATLAHVARTKLKAKNAAVVVAADCAYCQDLANGFEKAFSSGGHITSKTEVLEADTDFSTVIETLKKSTFDVVLVPNQELNSARIISALLKAGIRKPFLGGDGWGNVGDEFFSILGDQDLAGYSVSHWHKDVNTPRSRKFVSDYKTRFGKEPNDTSVLAYDSMLLLIDAAMRAKALTRQGVEDSLNNISSFNGVTGAFLYRKGMSAPEKSLVLLSANKKHFKVLETINKKSGGMQ